MSELPAPLPEFSSRMIMELAAKIHEPEEILERYGLSAADFKRLSQNPTFKAAYKEAKAFWESDANVRERIATKAAVLLEDALLDIHALAASKETAAGVRLQAFAQLATLAKVDGGEKTAPGLGNAGHVTINIDMGAQVVSMHAAAPALDGEYEVVDEG